MHKQPAWSRGFTLLGFTALGLMSLGGQAEALTYRSAKLGISFEVPADWTPDHLEGMQAVYLAPVRVENFTPNLALVVGDAPANQTEQQVIQAVKDAGRAVPGTRNFSWQTTKVAGIGAYLLAFDTTSEGQTIHTEQLMVIHNHHTYVLNGAAPKSASAVYTPLFQKVFQSVRFLK